MPDTPEVLKAAEAASLLRCSRAWLYRQVAAGVLPAYHVGADLRFVREDLINWLRTQTSPLRTGQAPRPPRRPRRAVQAPVQVNAEGPLPVHQRPVQEQVQEAVQTPVEAASGYYDPDLDLTRPLPPLGHKPYLTPEQKRERMVWIVTAVRRGKAIGEAGDLAGIASRATVHRWRGETPEFDRAVKEAARAAKEAGGR